MNISTLLGVLTSIALAFNIVQANQQDTNDTYDGVKQNQQLLQELEDDGNVDAAFVVETMEVERHVMNEEAQLDLPKPTTTTTIDQKVRELSHSSDYCTCENNRNFDDDDDYYNDDDDGFDCRDFNNEQRCERKKECRWTGNRCINDRRRMMLTMGGVEVEDKSEEGVEMEMEEDRELGVVTSQVYDEEKEDKSSQSVTSQVVVKSSAASPVDESSTGSLDDGGGGTVVSSRIFGQGNRRNDDDDYYEDDDDDDDYDDDFCSDIKNKQRCNNRDNCRWGNGKCRRRFGGNGSSSKSWSGSSSESWSGSSKSNKSDGNGPSQNVCKRIDRRSKCENRGCRWLPRFDECVARIGGGNYGGGSKWSSSSSSSRESCKDFDKKKDCLRSGPFGNRCAWTCTSGWGVWKGNEVVNGDHVVEQPDALKQQSSSSAIIANSSGSLYHPANVIMTGKKSYVLSASVVTMLCMMAWF